jgi:hypothetical protein
VPHDMGDHYKNTLPEFDHFVDNYFHWNERPLFIPASLKFRKKVFLVHIIDDQFQKGYLDKMYLRSNKKEVILVTAHVPDERRQKILRDLVSSIDKDLYDVVISANTQVPEDILRNSRYVVFDSTNELVYDFDKKIRFWYGNETFAITSTEVKEFNHIVAAQRLVTNGLSWCKAAGYEKVHFLEYDSEIENYDVFNENSKILDNFSLVYYLHQDLGLYSSYSANLKSLPDFWFDADQEKLYDFMKSDKEKIIEVYGYHCLLDSVNGHQRDLEKDYRRSVKSNLFNTDLDGYWSTVLVKDEDVFWWVNNLYPQDSIRSSIIVNDSASFETTLGVDGWNLQKIGKTQDVKNVKIFVEENLKREYDFTKLDIIKFGHLNNIRFYEN